VNEVREPGPMYGQVVVLVVLCRVEGMARNCGVSGLV
jgi:hypothetical protein